MLQILLRIRSQDELLIEFYAIEALNSDKALFELSIAAHLNERRDWLDTILSQDLASGITWRKQRAEKLKGFVAGNVLPVSDAWPDGPIQDQPEQRKVNAAIWRHKEACAKYWWEKYWQSSSDDDAYAAWVLFLDVVDRRAYVWMNIEEIKYNKTLPNIKHRLTHFYCNFTNLKSAMRDQERKLDSEFLGRKIVDSVGPWRKQ